MRLHPLIFFMAIHVMALSGCTLIIPPHVEPFSFESACLAYPAQEARFTPLRADQQERYKGAFVKILGRGAVSKAITVKAHGFSKSAEAAIIAAGGSVEIVPLPWGDGRRPSLGNQLMNR